MFDETEEPRFPVVAYVVIEKLDSLRAAHEDGDLVAVDVCVKYADILAPFNSDCHSGGRIGIGIRVDSLQRCSPEVDGDIIAADPDDRRIEGGGRGEAVGVSLYMHRGGDDESWVKIDGGLR